MGQVAGFFFLAHCVSIYTFHFHISYRLSVFDALRVEDDDVSRRDLPLSQVDNVSLLQVSPFGFLELSVVLILTNLHSSFIDEVIGICFGFIAENLLEDRSNNQKGKFDRIHNYGKGRGFGDDDKSDETDDEDQRSRMNNGVEDRHEDS